MFSTSSIKRDWYQCVAVILAGLEEHKCLLQSYIPTVGSPRTFLSQQQAKMWLPATGPAPHTQNAQPLPMPMACPASTGAEAATAEDHLICRGMGRTGPAACDLQQPWAPHKPHTYHSMTTSRTANKSSLCRKHCTQHESVVP